MASMRPIKTLSILSLCPILQASACRAPIVFQRQNSYAQCFPSVSFPPPSFAYRIASSFSAKGRRFDPKVDLFTFNPLTPPLPRRGGPKQQPTSGQDAYFVSSIGDSANVAFGVADGVGGWSDSGIDSAYFSHGLCDYMTMVAQDQTSERGRKLRAAELLQKGYDGVVADESIPGGGSTACIAVGQEDGNLEVANLGDSGFVQLRPNAVHYSSNPQTHAFNTPYQLSIIPPRILARAKIFGGSPLSDYPRDASITDHQVRHGDVLVFATDGVWDNLNSTDLLKLVSRYMTGFNAWEAGKEGMTVSDQLEQLTVPGGIPKEYENTLQALLAVAITGEAKMASQNSKLDGPFAREVHKFYPQEDYHGGKVDDICVVVAVIVQQGAGKKEGIV